MKAELTREINRLKTILKDDNVRFKAAKGASPEYIAKVEKEVGIKFDPFLKEMWKFSNGSLDFPWFAEGKENPELFNFARLKDARDTWSYNLPYDEAILQERSIIQPKRDPRIQPKLMLHRHWFPIAEYNGFSTAIYFDGNPAKRGKYGQIIVAFHDPPGVFYVAESFIDFFKKSNDLLAKAGENLLGDYIDY